LPSAPHPRQTRNTPPSPSTQRLPSLLRRTLLARSRRRAARIRRVVRRGI
jgi:hypothetical protein